MHEFKSHLARYIAQAQSGVIELTSHRRVVARLVGVRRSEHAGVSRLLATGAASWQGGKPKGASVVLHQGGRPVSALVMEDRG